MKQLKDNGIKEVIRLVKNELKNKANINHNHDSVYVNKSGDSLKGNIYFENEGVETTEYGLGGNCSTNDYWRIFGRSFRKNTESSTATGDGYLEIATGDDANEPIYVRQYGPGGNYGCFVPEKLVRTATLLDENGNTSFPGTLDATDVIIGPPNTYPRISIKDNIDKLQNINGSPVITGDAILRNVKIRASSMPGSSVLVINVNHTFHLLSDSYNNETKVYFGYNNYSDIHIPFSFGIDSNGNYGYKKIGADTVTPFKYYENIGTINNGFRDNKNQYNFSTSANGNDVLILDKNSDNVYRYWFFSTNANMKNYINKNLTIDFITWGPTFGIKSKSVAWQFTEFTLNEMKGVNVNKFSSNEVESLKALMTIMNCNIYRLSYSGPLSEQVAGQFYRIHPTNSTISSLRALYYDRISKKFGIIT